MFYFEITDSLDFFLLTQDLLGSKYEIPDFPECHLLSLKSFISFPFFLFFLEYYESSYYSQYECNVPLLDRAVISATSALRERGPENARLNGKCFVFKMCSAMLVNDAIKFSVGN